MVAMFCVGNVCDEQANVCGAEGNAYREDNHVVGVHKQALSNSSMTYRGQVVVGVVPQGCIVLDYSVNVAATALKPCLQVSSGPTILEIGITASWQGLASHRVGGQRVAIVGVDGLQCTVHCISCGGHSNQIVVQV